MSEKKLGVDQVVNYNLVKYTVTVADLKALGTGTTGNVPLITLPAGAVVQTTTVKDSVAVAGAGPITVATARVATANNNYGSGTLNVVDAVGVVAGTDYIFDGAPRSENIATTTPLYLAMAQTGGTSGFTSVTAGSIDVWITYFIRSVS